MKRIKKLVSLMLAVVMVLSLTMATTVFGAETTYTITINNTKTGHTYEAYQIFTGDLSENTLSNVVWGTGVKNGELLTALKEIELYQSCETAADVAKVLENKNSVVADAFAAIVSKHLTEDASGTSTENKTESVTTNYTISGLQAGYYLVKDQDNSVSGQDAYTKFVLKIVKDTEVTPKSDVPSTEKKVYENVKTATELKTGKGGNNYNDVADYNIGDNVPFAFYSKVPDMSNYTTFKYVFEDKMSTGLQFNNDVTVTIGSTTLTNTQFSVITGESLNNDGCTFHVVINDLKLIDAATKGAEIRVDFTAKLTDSAVIGLEGNPNEMKLVFSNNPNDTNSTGETPWDKVIVFTYELDTTKVDGSDNDIKLGGAEFKLYREKTDDSKEYVKVDNDSKVTGWTDNETDASVLTSDNTTDNTTGLFKVIGLDDGTYYLEETKAPDGYNLLSAPIKIVITATTKNDQNWTSGTASEALTALKIKVGEGAETDGNKETGIVSATVENNKGSVLPETGGMGTTIFYVVGSVLVLGAAILLITRKRMNSGK